MGLSFYDEESMIESFVESLHFASNQPNLTKLTGDDGIHWQGRGNDDSIQLNDDDIEMVDRRSCKE
jgi:hypothetical protein